MAVPTLFQLGRQAVEQALRRCADDPDLPCLAAVDGTCGNGGDTLFLAKTLASFGGKPYGLFAFDVQEAALEATRARLERGGFSEYVRLVPHSHARLREMLGDTEAFPPLLRETESPLRIAAAMYNLGFLPRSDKRVTTVAGHTLASLDAAAAALACGGILAVHAYGGHPGGREELEAVDSWCTALPFDEWTAARYTLCNKPRNPEALFLVGREQRRERTE